MHNYYFLATLLPELKLDAHPEISVELFNDLLKQHLTEADFAKVKVIKRIFDLENLRSYWSGNPIDPFGNFDPASLEEALLTQKNLPAYVIRHIEQYETQSERLAHFSKLCLDFFQEEISESDPDSFVGKWLRFERDLRVGLAASRAETLGKEFNADYESVLDLKEIQAKQSPMELYHALSEFAFKQAGELVGLERFNVDRILSYLIQLILVEKQTRLKSNRGHKILQEIA